MNPIRVLYVNGGPMSRGGIEAFMMNYYNNFDRSKIQVDFIVHGFEEGFYENEIKAMGGKIYNVPVKSNNYLGNIKAIKEIFKSGRYKIVHSHMDAMSYVVLREAKRCGIPIRIAHSHNTQHLTKNKLKILLNEYARKNIVKYATHFFACSLPAANWLFGNEMVNENKVNFINNAISIEKYKFNEDVRREVRKELKVENNFVIGHVGRFDYQKNHKFLLNLFCEILKIKSNAKLVLVGDGHLRQSIGKDIKLLGIEDKVILCGVREDVDRLFNGFDFFCFPSLFEGLGMVLMEAQANGLKCLASDQVPSEVNISGLVKFLSLNSDYSEWVKSMDIEDEYKREVKSETFNSSGYSISQEALKLQNLYLDLISGKLEGNSHFVE
jgi:glycosyltransferase involved in cell wall biosynthesis